MHNEGNSSGPITFDMVEYSEKTFKILKVSSTSIEGHTRTRVKIAYFQLDNQIISLISISIILISTERQY